MVDLPLVVHQHRFIVPIVPISRHSVKIGREMVHVDLVQTAGSVIPSTTTLDLVDLVDLVVRLVGLVGLELLRALVHVIMLYRIRSISIFD